MGNGRWNSLNAKLSYYEKVLELNSSDAYCYNQLGNFLKEKGNYKNGNLDGDWQDYYENGQARTKGNYIEGIPFGLWEHFTEEGLSSSKTTYNKKGSEEGYFENYHMNGKIRSRGFYKNQQYDGLWELFYQNGQISQRGNFKDGEKVGQWEYFHESGVSLDPDYYSSYQMEKSSDEQEYTPENNVLGCIWGLLYPPG